MTSRSAKEVLLAGDIGGTKTSLALYRPKDNLLQPYDQTTVSNRDASGLEEIVNTFLQQAGSRPDAACFGVAGPVRDNKVRMTNLEWTLEGQALAKRFGLSAVTLINDLVATAMGAVHLPAARLFTINAGEPDPAGAIGVIAPGTGLGEAFLVHHRDGFLPIPSEGGHCAFSPADDQQRRLLHNMSQQHNHVSVEMVCSGMGIPSLYDFLRTDASDAAAPELRDRTRHIVDAALAAHERNEEGHIALMTMHLFTAILAAEAANLALKILATGGIYIGGGIPPRILSLLQPEKFMDFFARGTYRDMLAAIPVHVILEPQTALIGAAAYGRAHRVPPGEEI